MSGSDWVNIASLQQMNRDGASDQSTRADTSASVPTPEGSGDSSPDEESADAPQSDKTSQDWSRQRKGERAQRRHCTTMMLTNVPQFLTQGALMLLLEDLSTYMREAFDFFYCPWDPYQDRNLGYAIVNFFSRSVAAEFEQQWGNQKLLPGMPGAKKLRIMPAALQGRAANLRHFSGFSLAHHKDPRFRPLARAGPSECLQPMALAEEIAESDSRSPATTSPPAGTAAQCDQTTASAFQSPQVAMSSQAVPGAASTMWPPEVLAALATAMPTGMMAPMAQDQASLLSDLNARQQALMILLKSKDSTPNSLAFMPPSAQVPNLAESMNGGGQRFVMPGLPPENLQAKVAAEAPNSTTPYAFLPGVAGNPSGCNGGFCVPSPQLRYLQQLEAYGAYPDRGM
ncbi:unnamed protein product [Effrenium voratum]|nr:unnamed protein product [Effrenium voratum]